MEGLCLWFYSLMDGTLHERLVKDQEKILENVFACVM
jgi:hypothetical protein